MGTRVRDSEINSRLIKLDAGIFLSLNYRKIRIRTRIRIGVSSSLVD